MQVGQKTNKPQVTLTLVKWAASDFLSEADRLTVHDALTKASSRKTSSDCQVLPAMSFREIIKSYAVPRSLQDIGSGFE